jgi:hypothetical protein
MEDLEGDAALREALFAFVDLSHASFAYQAADEVFAELLHAGCLLNGN